MNQRTYLGARPTLLDVAKDVVEKFLKARARDLASRGDRYMLMTFEEYPLNIKAGWKESHAVFMNELKHLMATGVTNMGPALKSAFDLLNLNRMQSGIDMYGLGRAPYYLEPSMIIVITDGSSLTYPGGVQQTLELPMQTNAVPGSELTREPFRWDQRLFSLVLRLTGAPPSDSNPTAISNLPDPIGPMCAVTGGRSYLVTTQRSILQSIEALVQKVQSGVVIQFEKVGPDPPPVVEPPPSTIIAANNGSSTTTPVIPTTPVTPTNQTNNPLASQTQQDTEWHSTRSLIYVHRALQKNFPIGHWPIPEAYWPDQNLTVLPPRTAHPIVKFSCVQTEPHMMDVLPFDKYELESSPLTQYILSRKQPHVAWQVFITNSGRIPGELGAPFGYLKAATSLNCVNLLVMPYNYPVLLPLIDEMLKKPQYPGKPIREWKPAFDEYLKSMPAYYATPLKRALTRMGAQANVVPDNLEGSIFGYAVHSKLKGHKNEAKAQFERLVQTLQHQTKNQNHDAVRVLQCGNSLRSQVESTSYNNMGCLGRPTQAFYHRYSAMKQELNEFSNYMVRVRDKATFTCNENLRIKHTFRNPYDIDRKDLIDQIHLMRMNLMQSPSRIKFKDEDQMHTLPVSQMGNYQDYLKKQPTPLREIESTPVRQHMFGNPFKIDKKGMMVDEADSLGLTDLGSPSQKNKKLNPNQRRRGPLPKDFILLSQNGWRRTPSVSPNSSPCPSPSPSSQVASDNDESNNGNNKAAQSIELLNGNSRSPSSSSSSSNSFISASSGDGSLADTQLESSNSGSNNNNINNSNNSHSNNKRTQGYLTFSEQELDLRKEIYKLIKGPNLNNAAILKKVSLLQGDARKFIIHEAILEAKRFKRSRLLHQLRLIKDL